ncbi:unnamed protein product, partial [Brassica rapa subsp. trilocularis]
KKSNLIRLINVKLEKLGEEKSEMMMRSNVDSEERKERKRTHRRYRDGGRRGKRERNLFRATRKMVSIKTCWFINYLTRKMFPKCRVNHT